METPEAKLLLALANVIDTLLVDAEPAVPWAVRPLLQDQRDMLAKAVAEFKASGGGGE